MPTGIYQHKKGYKRLPFSEEWKRKISKALIGRKLSEEHKQRMGEANKGKIISEETRKKISESEKGKLVSEESKARMRKAIRPPITEKTKKKMSKIFKGKRLGKENPYWKGGNSSRYRAKNAPRPKPEQCEICGSFGIICFDHDHKTGEFRGWICKRCNSVLGFVRDNKELLLMMVDYLKNSPPGNASGYKGN